MIDNCALVASSGVNRIMHMGTYNAASYQAWVQRELAPAIAPSVPRASVGLGLGVWNDSEVAANPWNLEPASAKERICSALNHSFVELDLFILSQGDPDPTKNFPAPHWIPELERFMAGGSCAETVPDTIACPKASAGHGGASEWLPGGDAGCCTSSEKRGTLGHPLSCNETCAQAECAAAVTRHNIADIWVAFF